MGNDKPSADLQALKTQCCGTHHIMHTQGNPSICLCHLASLDQLPCIALAVGWEKGAHDVCLAAHTPAQVTYNAALACFCLLLVYIRV
jgi:hypothetical protein